MRGWKNGLIIGAIWATFLIVGSLILPDWILVSVAIYMFVGDIICHSLKKYAPIDSRRFDWTGTWRSLYWTAWWPMYIVSKQ